MSRPGPTSSTAARTARNVVVSAGSQVLGKAGTLVWTVVAARALTPSEFGTFFFVLSLALLVSAVAEWGFDPVMVQRASARPQERSQLFTQALAWQTLLAVPFFLAAAAVLWQVRPAPEDRAVVALLLVAVLLDMWSDTSRAASAAAQDQRGTAAALVVQRAVTAAAACAALLAGFGLVGLAAAFLLGSVVGAVGATRALRRLGVHVVRRAVARRAMRAFGSGTLSIGLSALVLVVLFRVDSVVLAAFRGDEEVGFYAATYRLLETVLFVAFAVKGAVFPVMSATGTPEAIRRGMESALAAAGAVFLPFAVVCLVEAEQVLHLLYGEPYDERGAAALRWLALSPLVFFIGYVGNGGLQIRGRTRAMLTSAVAATVANLVLNLLLVPRFGVPAAAAVTLVSYALLAGLVLVTLRSAGARVRVLRPLRSAAVASVPLAGVLLALEAPLLVQLAAGGLVYGVVWALAARRWDEAAFALLRGYARRR